MADNYLENQYEKYLARKAAWEKSKKYGKRTPAKPKTCQQNAPTDTKMPPETEKSSQQ
ncbi:MAG: hypothetical protein IJ494_05660 [Bacteroides sp.]|nr:hypothetical protein [Bacteroides sp.]